MTLKEARTRAMLLSIREEYKGCNVFVTAKLMKTPNGEAGIDPNGYLISEWFDGMVFETYCNGKKLGE